MPPHQANELVWPAACFWMACQLRGVDTFLNSEREFHHAKSDGIHVSLFTQFYGNT